MCKTLERLHLAKLERDLVAKRVEGVLQVLSDRLYELEIYVKAHADLLIAHQEEIEAIRERTGDTLCTET